MPERDFFTLRYALPGYTFILIMVLVAYPRLIELFPLSEPSLDLTLVSAFVAFFTLLSGGAIGFLVSQFWYALHNSIFHSLFLRKTRKMLRDKFKLKENAHREIIFLDYIFHLSDSTTIDYIQRRFDLKHTLGSTFFAIIFGSIFGVAVKSNFFSYEMGLENVANSINFVSPSFTTYDVAVVIIVFTLSIIVLNGFFFISREHSLMVDVVVKKVLKKNPEGKGLHIRDYFTEDDYFIKDEDNNSQNQQ